MSHSPETLRLYNTGQTQISLYLNRAQPKTAARLRRGAQLHPVRIVPGRFFDVCKDLGVAFDEAERIVRQSPQVKHHERANRLLVREHPPAPKTLEVEAEEQSKIDDAAAKLAELNPPKPPGIPAGIDQVAAGLRSEGDPPLRVDEGQPSIPSATPDVDDPAPSDPAPSDPAPSESSESAPSEPASSDAAPSEPAVEPVVEPAPSSEEAPPAEAVKASESVEQPSMDWGEDRLRTFAEDHNIDLGRVSSKTAVLKRIRKAMSG